MSEQWRTEKVRRPRAEVEPLVQMLDGWFTQRGVKFEFGGSWRRGVEKVGDIDVIVVTDDSGLEGDLFGAGVELPSMVRWDRRGKDVAQGSIVLADKSEIHVDVWAVRPEQLGAFMWFVTGPKELNIAMRKLALRKGMNLSQIGLLRTDPQTGDVTQVDDGTERDVALKLGWPWMEPAQRQQWLTDVQSDESMVQRWRVEGSKATAMNKSEYEVRRTSAGVWSCTCPHFTYRGAVCKHIKKIKDANKELAPPTPVGGFQ